MKISVIIPCYNEEITIKQVIEEFRKYLPEAEINVFDNNSKDNSVKLAKESGAIVTEKLYAELFLILMLIYILWLMQICSMIYLK